MGCSNPHPHSQIWSGNFLPNEAAIEDREQKKYWQEKSSPLLLDYARREIQNPLRVVESNAHWVVVVPFWAVWPYEALLLPLRHVARLPDLTEAERAKPGGNPASPSSHRYDNLFETSFLVFDGLARAVRRRTIPAPAVGRGSPPPLLRWVAVEKFMVGDEMLAETAARPHAGAKRRCACGNCLRFITASGDAVCPGSRARQTPVNRCILQSCHNIQF